ncbi:MAG: glycine--tRNA ligase subunit beta [Pseudomonadota bacterium]
MPELLLELFSEEIPARMQARAGAELERAVNANLIEAGFLPEGVKAFAGPRRLTLVATGLPAVQPDRREEKKGPRVGAPDRAIDGFLNSAGLSSLDQCETREDKKGAYYLAVIEQKGRATADIIADIVPEIVRGFPWPKSMRWGERDLRWVRPLHGVLCVFNSEVVPFEIEGIRSGDETQGHRFMAPGAIQARNFDAYAERLRSAHVMLDAAEREETIAADAATICAAQSLELVEDAGLLKEVAGLVEWPFALMGAFDEKFLALPDEVLTASMRNHQKYFSVRDPKADRLANRFVCVANIEAPDGGAAMRVGYERVLTARLSDAWYLYNQDLKTTLEERIADLDRITFFEGLGSVGDKARRIAALAKEIAPAVGADPALVERAAMLAKADLVSQMVYEFPELQGVMGRYYALEQSESAEIADAIRDHYKPAGQDDGVPTAPVSVAVALADKIDTLTAFWAIDKKPTGSSDPFALRRAALGVISLILENRLRLDLDQAIRSHFRALGDVHAESLAEDLTNASSLVQFFHERLTVHFRDRGARHDHVSAVLVDPDGQPHDDFVLIEMRLRALETFLGSDDGANLAAAFKRAANILKAEKKKDALPDDLRVDQNMLAESDEKALFSALREAESTAKAAVAGEDFEAAMAALSQLRAPIDAFFESVTVNADDADIRANRLALLDRFIAATSSVADFSKLEG